MAQFMESPLDMRIKSELTRYILGQKSLQEFREWFDSSTWDTELDDRSTSDLIGEIELRLAEFSAGHLAENELRELLLTLIVDSPVRTGSSNTTEPLITLSLGNSLVDTQYEVEFA
jgi:hypothetical protein